MHFWIHSLFLLLAGGSINRGINGFGTRSRVMNRLRRREKRYRGAGILTYSWLVGWLVEHRTVDEEEVRVDDGVVHSFQQRCIVVLVSTGWECDDDDGSSGGFCALQVGVNRGTNLSSWKCSWRVFWAWDGKKKLNKEYRERVK